MTITKLYFSFEQLHSYQSSQIKSIEHPFNLSVKLKQDDKISLQQCDHIGQFIGLWATFQSLVVIITLPKSRTFLGNFCKGLTPLQKSAIFLVKSFLGNFCRHLATFYWSRCLFVDQIKLLRSRLKLFLYSFGLTFFLSTKIPYL